MIIKWESESKSKSKLYNDIQMWRLKKKQGFLQLIIEKHKGCQFPKGFYFPSLRFPRTELLHSLFGWLSQPQGLASPVRDNPEPVLRPQVWCGEWNSSFMSLAIWPLLYLIALAQPVTLGTELPCESFSKISNGDNEPPQLPHPVGCGPEEAEWLLGEEAF